MKRKLILAGLAALFFGFGEVAAQDIVARVAGLEENKEYMDLLRSDDKLRQQTDSLMAVVREVRGAMRANVEAKDSLVQVRSDSMMLILSDAENAIFSMRSQKIKLIDRINAIEQKFVLEGLGNIGGAQNAQASGSIFKNEYFTKSLEADDLKMLIQMQGKESTAREYATTYVKNYNNIKTLYDRYLQATTEADAEALYAQMATSMDENFVLERQLAKLWSEIYDHKIYVYSYFLEKENREDILEITESMMMEARQQKLLSVDNCASESLADYCLQKPVALNYEMYVAKLLNLTSSIDSLSAASRTVRQIDYRLPIIDVERRSFVDYEAIEFHSRSPYNSSNPIPECVSYEYGTIYRILLGTYKVKQSPSIFRGAAPLFVEQLEDGRFAYYAGGLHTSAEAEAAVEVMKKKGFRNPQIVEWCDGRKTNLDEQGEGEQMSFRISIKGGALDDTVKEVISTMAEGAQLSKVADDEFLLGMFPSLAMAERVAQAIMKCDETLAVEVVDMRPEAETEEANEDEEDE